MCKANGKEHSEYSSKFWLDKPSVTGVVEAEEETASKGSDLNIY